MLSPAVEVEITRAPLGRVTMPDATAPGGVALLPAWKMR